MKPKLYYFSAVLTASVLLTVVLSGCGASGKPSNRKKMPNGDASRLNPLSYTAAFAGGLPYNTGDIDLQWEGSAQTFLAIGLPDPAYDSLAFSLVMSHVDYAAPLLTQWSAGEKKGFIIDLRSGPSPDTRREDLVIEKPGAFSIPVIFLWDPLCANRAASFMSLLHMTPAVQCRHTGGTVAYGQQDCFQSSGSLH